MALTGNTNEQKIWNYLKSKIKNNYGVAGLMGNLYAESGLRPDNLQNSYEKSLELSDTAYTQAVDKGTYTNFVKDKAGYGLAQWTYWSRKQNLLNFIKSKKVSIGDLEAQLDFLYKELSENYSSILHTLENATSVLQASNEVLLKFEKPANQSITVQNKRAEYSQVYYDKYATTTTTTNTNKIDNKNSNLVDIVVKSPNHSGKRTHSIDRISPHCVVGQLSAESIGGCFTSPSRQASCNYGIGTDGRVVLCVDENNRSWCTSSNANDQRAVTIECASDKADPYAFNDKVYNKLIDLCVDICKRNGKKKLLWFADKNTALNYNPKADEIVLTVHRWFAAKACPGDWLMSKMNDLTNKVNTKLGAVSSSVETLPSSKPPATNTSAYLVRVTADSLNIRKGPGTNYGINGSIKDKGIYTIIETNGSWGRLKSGLGWISLNYTQKV